MANQKIIRAWKDPAYRNSLSEAERAALPANPAGSIELSDADLGNIAGGGSPGFTYFTYCRSFYCSFRCITYFLTCTVKLP
jgi:mersacidin/lichenicidin family type 2 lantibiotic